MSRALDLINRINEIGYYGQHDDYGTKGYDNDAGEYRKPFQDLQLPDKAGAQVSTPTRSHQIRTDKRKSRREDNEGNKVQ